ncbi:hypothetical protein LCL96_01380 [Rossellomorea aquimaris]|uniref:hypothetical protein n=1 Tax=Rossellomorea aquimaris TaxID=189382 RepID=UPI001CD3F035|nr:hypothetical protein [Rossellomorea aquimaris]MCA1057567.1 hypothetical protein [Rossellomorea aquimaris]
MSLFVFVGDIRVRLSALTGILGSESDPWNGEALMNWGTDPILAEVIEDVIENLSNTEIKPDLIENDDIKQLDGEAEFKRESGKKVEKNANMNLIKKTVSGNLLSMEGGSRGI